MHTSKIIWTKVDEAPALATYSLLPIIKAFTDAAGVAEFADAVVASPLLSGTLVSGDGDEAWGTVGVSENIMEASWQALVDSVEYKLMKDGARPAGKARPGRAKKTKKKWQQVQWWNCPLTASWLELGPVSLPGPSSP